MNNDLDNFLSFFIKEYVKTRNGESRIKSSVSIEKESYVACPEALNWIFNAEKFLMFFGFSLSKVEELQHTLYNDEILIITFLNDKKEEICRWPIDVKDRVIAINKEWQRQEERTSGTPYDGLPF